MENVVVVTGSPRKGGNTELLAEALIKGIKDAGNAVDVISVRDESIHSCIGCNYCYSNEEHNCVFKDDMTKIYKKLASADVIVWATPIYFYGVSSQLKQLIDRLHNPIRETFKVKKLGLLAVCADDKEFVFDSVKIMYRDAIRYFSLNDGGIVTACGVKNIGDIKNNQKLAEAEEMGRSL